MPPEYELRVTSYAHLAAQTPYDHTPPGFVRAVRRWRDFWVDGLDCSPRDWEDRANAEYSWEYL